MLCAGGGRPPSGEAGGRQGGSVGRILGSADKSAGPFAEHADREAGEGEREEGQIDGPVRRNGGAAMVVGDDEDGGTEKSGGERGDQYRGAADRAWAAGLRGSHVVFLHTVIGSERAY